MDGTYNPDTDAAAWSFVVIVDDDEGGQWYAGHQDGVVGTKKGIGDYLGATKNSSDVAELHAMAWATMWCLQYCIGSVTLCYGSRYARGDANSLYNTSVNKTIVKVLSGLTEILK